MLINLAKASEVIYFAAIKNQRIMATRTQRSFSEQEKNNLLKELSNWRSVCISVCAKAPIKAEVYKMADKLIADIDSAVEVLKGDRKYLHAKPHAT